MTPLCTAQTAARLSAVPAWWNVINRQRNLDNSNSWQMVLSNNQQYITPKYAVHISYVQLMTSACYEQLESLVLVRNKLPGIHSHRQLNKQQQQQQQQHRCRRRLRDYQPRSSISSTISQRQTTRISLALTTEFQQNRVSFATVHELVKRHSWRICSLFFFSFLYNSRHLCDKTSSIQNKALLYVFLWKL